MRGPTPRPLARSSPCSFTAGGTNRPTRGILGRAARAQKVCANGLWPHAWPNRFGNPEAYARNILRRILQIANSGRKQNAAHRLQINQTPFKYFRRARIARVEFWKATCHSKARAPGANSRFGHGKARPKVIWARQGQIQGAMADMALPWQVLALVWQVLALAWQLLRRWDFQSC